MLGPARAAMLHHRAGAVSCFGGTWHGPCCNARQLAKTRSKGQVHTKASEALKFHQLVSAHSCELCLDMRFFIERDAGAFPS